MFGEFSKPCSQVVDLTYHRFVHERGFRTAIFNLGVLGGINLAQPIGTAPLTQLARSLVKKCWLTTCHVAGAIIQYGSYKIAFYAMGGAFGLSLILVFLWMPETAFARVGAVNLDIGSNDVGFDIPHSTHSKADIT